MNIDLLLSILLCLFFPWLSQRLYRNARFPRWLSPIVSSYLIGILIGNLRLWEVPTEPVTRLAEGGMLLALPLLLFSIRLEESWRYTGRMLLSFFLCCLSGMLCTSATAWWLHGTYDDGWRVAGMLTGLYTGGTPNMQAIGIALDAPAEYVVLLQAADIIGGGIYLLLLISILPAFLGRFFPPSDSAEGPQRQSDELDTPATRRHFAGPLLLTACIVAAAAGCTYLLRGNLSDSTLLILLLTTFSLVASFLPQVRTWVGVYGLGEYFLLIFCVALGLLADFRELLSDGLPLLVFSLIALVGTILLHLVFSRLLRIDRDTVILSSVAALYGPVFVAQVAAALRNPRLLAPGIAVGLLGFAIGNYLGLAVAYAVKWWGG